jgi:phosphate:Na+ symporter
VRGPPESEEDQERLTRTLHGLDHALRLAEAAREKGQCGPVPSGSEDARAAELCAGAMRNAALIAGAVGALPDAAGQRALAETPQMETSIDEGRTAQALSELEQCVRTLGELQLSHRKVTLSAVAGGGLSAEEALARVETVRRIEAMARHAWRSAAYLIDSGAQSSTG